MFFSFVTDTLQIRYDDHNGGKRMAIQHFVTLLRSHIGLFSFKPPPHSAGTKCFNGILFIITVIVSTQRSSMIWYMIIDLFIIKV